MSSNVWVFFSTMRASKTHCLIYLKPHTSRYAGKRNEPDVDVVTLVVHRFQRLFNYITAVSQT